MDQIICWLIDNIAGAIISAIVGLLLGVGGTIRYYARHYSVTKKQSQKGGDNSQNIQVNGYFSANNIEK